jgi:hypothetical protein
MSSENNKNQAKDPNPSMPESMEEVMEQNQKEALFESLTKSDSLRQVIAFLHEELIELFFEAVKANRLRQVRDLLASKQVDVNLIHVVNKEDSRGRAWPRGDG